VTRMYWTFDPLESRNAYLNLSRLGAVVREYAPDMYGVSDSPLHRGLGTDRFVVTWELDTARVQA
ncbi:MAG: acetyltransferase, partial [Gemmatimonadetes bacterium]|nr:acetyltransferase [Akkermansiaceae bacterium]NIR79102.1 acetyltransferase [Gemmatimonadota bacterium]NIU48045.1 acetyltransferase [Thermoplasmata archaeon]NIX38319.1 acetyltransferase [Gemmatimonadota bacterium]